MSKKKSGLSKAAKGVAFGDVSNAGIRNILTEISKKFFDDFTQSDMEEAMEKYFGWCCPYTGNYLKDEYDRRTGNYATDHIYPQNKEWCGLNVKGNLVLVDKEANNAKKGLDVMTFLGKDSKFCKDRGIDDITREDRLKKIKDFQTANGYAPDQIRNIVSSILETRYSEIRDNQETCIHKVESALNAAGIHPVRTTEVGDTSAKALTKSSGRSTRKYTENDMYKEAAYYLRNNVGLPEVERNVLGCDNRGSSAMGHLNKLGIDTSRTSKHKGLLVHISIDDAIANATGEFKATLEEIKKRGL